MVEVIRTDANNPPVATRWRSLTLATEDYEVARDNPFWTKVELVVGGVAVRSASYL